MPYRSEDPESLDNRLFGGSARLAMAMNNHFSAYERFQYQDTHSNSPKHEEFLSLAGSVSLLNSSPSFMNLAANNPLLSQQGTILKQDDQSPVDRGHDLEDSFCSFKPMNHATDGERSTEKTEADDMAAEDIKVESQLCNLVHPSINHEPNDPTFAACDNWDTGGMLDGLPGEPEHGDSHH